jgi:hypothetical protein
MKLAPAKPSADPVAIMGRIVRGLSAIQDDLADLAHVLEAQQGDGAGAGVGPVPRHSRTTPQPRKRPSPPDADVIADRLELWSRYFVLYHSKTGSLTTKLFFASSHKINPSEFSRWFSATSSRGIPAGSEPDRSIRRALEQAIRELEDVTVPKPHGTAARSQSASAVRP